MKDEILNDIKKEIELCEKPEYYGNICIRVNIQSGQIRNVNFTPERTKKYE